MDIRKLTTGEERYASAMISATCFHTRIEEMEKFRAEAERDTTEDWGAFSEDGTMMAHILNNQFTYRFDGNWVTGGGIGGVSTLPEYRNSGAIRKIFGQLLEEARKSGEIISSLYPFNHAFYRSFGYETVVYRRKYEFEPAVLRQYRFEGETIPWKAGDSPAEYLKLYTQFANNFNMAVQREEKTMLEKHLPKDGLKSRKFAYLLRENGEAIAYVIFQDIRHDPAPILSVQDYAWNGRRGWNALLGFLARFSADYGTIEISLPQGMDLLSLIHCPDAYAISERSIQNFMVRVMNVPVLLRLMQKPEDASFTIQVRDDLLPENTGCWRVQHQEVTPCDLNGDSKVPDISLSIQAFSQLAVGAVSLSEAALRDDVEIYQNEDVLGKVFSRKPIHIADYF